MSKALFWKEWRQLALVRWGGVAIGAILPLAFSVGAELASRGLVPMGELKAYSTRDLMFEVLPAVLGLGLWPLMGLMATAQGFAGDRAAGTENFLLERPVPRVRVWWTRLAATLATLAVVIVATAGLGVIAAYFASSPPAFGWLRWQQWTAGGSAIALLAYLGGTIASSLLSSPLGAVLAGAVLGGLPIFVAVQLAAGFPFAQISAVPLGSIALVLLPFYVVASWSAFCRGEPAGRGRVKRALGIVVGALAGTLLLFAISAPLIVRAEAGRGVHAVLADPSGGSVFVVAGLPGAGGWIADVASGAKRAFVPPPIRGAAWSPDGTQLAVVTWSASLGGQRRDPRIDLLDAESGDVVRSIVVPEGRMIDDVVWAAGALVISSRELGGAHPARLLIDVADPRAGGWKPTGFTSENWGALSQADASGRVYVRLPHYEDNLETRRAYRGFELRPIDVAAARVGAPLSDAAGQPIYFAGWNAGLSRSGKLAIVRGTGGGRSAGSVQDVATGASLSKLDIPLSAQWLSDDRLVWVATLGDKTRLFVMRPGEAPVAIREWGRSQLGVEPAPDGRSVFVSVLPPITPDPVANASGAAPDGALFATEAPQGAVPEEGVFQADGDRWISVPTFSGVLNDQRHTQWAGPNTIARIANGVVFLEDLDKPAERRFVLGGEGDLR